MNEAQKQALKHIMSEPGWDELMRYVDVFVKRWGEEPVKRETEFDTIWYIAQRDAKGRALIEFFKEVEENVN